MYIYYKCKRSFIHSRSRKYFNIYSICIYYICYINDYLYISILNRENIREFTTGEYLCTYINIMFVVHTDDLLYLYVKVLEEFVNNNNGVSLNKLLY